MDSFLDTNVIVYYVNYDKESASAASSRSYFYILNKKSRFIICHAVIRELGNVVNKFSTINKEVLKKVINPDYDLEKEKRIAKKDILFAQKLYLTYKDDNPEEIKETFALERDRFEIGIEQFLKNKVDIKVISIEQIEIELVNIIRDFVDNFADCQILASAIQYQKDKEKFLFVTADGEHLGSNNYNFLKQDSRLKNHKFPKLLNFCEVS